MPSTFAWLDHSESERRKALDVVDLFREQGTRDELGIGTVRDTLADTLFPGISTIQTRAKYFLFVPWIYRALEENRTKSRDVARLGRKAEVDLIHQLLQSEDTDGVIGKDAKKNLQRLPSAVYWAGLHVFGIRRFGGSQDQYHRSLDEYYRGRLQVHASTEDGILELLKPQANWHDGIPEAPEGFPSDANLKLDRPEAQYLRHQMMAHAPHTFLAFLVDRSDGWKKTDFPWEHPQVGASSQTVQEELRHARLFSLVMHGAALLYNLMLAEKRAGNPTENQTPSSDLVDNYRVRLEEWHAAVRKAGRDIEAWAAARDVFWQVVYRVNARIPVPTQDFINTWINLALNHGNTASLIDARPTRELIHFRERRLKRGLARLDNARALEMWGGAAGTDRLSYRWSQAQVIVQDILRGLSKEPH